MVHGLCLRDKRLVGLPTPCAAVNRRQGWAVVRDPRGRTQVLLVPTRKISGIESPLLLASGGPNYWQYAWNSRRHVERRAGRPIPRDDLVLAINSQLGRTQNQLHIHVDCVKRGVRNAIAAHLAQIGPAWARLKIPLAGRFYQAMRLDGGDFGARDPFRILAAGDPVARADMGAETLAAVGVTWPGGRPGFVLLARRAGPLDGDPGASEELQDHHCAVLHALMAR